jgi:hypothetical protein
MISIDPRLDSKLRALYEHIEAESASHSLPGFEVPGITPRRRIFTLIAGLASVAVVAAGVTVFATELHSRTVKPPARTGSPSAVPLGLVSASELTAGLPAVSHVVLPVLRGSGSASLPTFTPSGMLFIKWDCAGSGSFALSSTTHSVGATGSQCAGSGTEGDFVSQVSPIDGKSAIDGKQLSLQITANPSVTWEIVVAQSPTATPLPFLGLVIKPGLWWPLLVPSKYGFGASEVETFTPIGPFDDFEVAFACTGTGAIEFSSPDGSVPPTPETCLNGWSGQQTFPKPTFGGPVHLSVDAPPTTLWEVMVFQG